MLFSYQKSHAYEIKGHISVIIKYVDAKDGASCMIMYEIFVLKTCSANVIYAKM